MDRRGGRTGKERRRVGVEDSGDPGRRDRAEVGGGGEAWDAPDVPRGSSAAEVSRGRRRVGGDKKRLESRCRGKERQRENWRNSLKEARRSESGEN